MPIKTLSPFNNAAIRLTADGSVQGFARARPLQRTHVAAGALGLLLIAPATTFALELGEASIKSGLGQSLLVEIPYRLAADERLTPACVALIPASRSAAALPTYTRVSRISISSTHIEIFDDNSVREPLIGLNVEVHCNTAPHFARSYQLFVDPPAQLNVSNGTQLASARKQSAIDAAATVATRQSDATRVIRNGTAAATTTSGTTATSRPTASAPITRTARANSSPRARGHVGGNLTQGQTYRVVRGDTLSGIAARISERPAPIRQTADAIFAANSNAFTRGNRDLIEEGRSITIPIMTPTTAALRAPPTPVPQPAVRERELATAAPVPTVNLAPAPTSATQPPRAEDAASVVAPVAIEPLPLPAPATVTQPIAAPVPAATRTDPAPEAPSRATTGRTSVWLIALLALGVVILLSAPFAFVRRRKQQAAAQAQTAGKVEKSLPRRPVDSGARIDVVEARLPRAASHDKAASTGSAEVQRRTDSGPVFLASLNDVALPTGPIDSVDLDVGAPVMMDERIDWFGDRADAAAVNAAAVDAAAAAVDAAAVGNEASEENAATVRMPDLETAATVRQPSPRSKADLLKPTADDDEMTMTIVELDMLRQDYEAEHTLTQQSSQALRDAIADLEATKAARDTTAETSTMELPQSQTETTDDSATSSQTARIRMKK